MKNVNTIPLIELCVNSKTAIVDGPFGSNLKTIHYRESGIPIIESGFVTSGIFNPTKYKYVDLDKFNSEIRSKVGPGDIVMAKIGANCGRSAIFPNNHEIGILSGNALKITVDPKKADPAYIWTVLEYEYSKNKLQKYQSTGAQPAISMSRLKQFPIPMLDKESQKYFVSMISDWDKGIMLSKKSLTACAKRYSVISEKIFAQLEQSTPKSFLNEFGDILSGGTPDTGNLNYWNGDIFWLTPSEITKIGYSRFVNKSERTITELGMKNSSAALFPKGSVVVSTRATVGEVALASVPMTTNQGFKIIIPNKLYESDFLFHGIKTLKQQMIRKATGSTFLELSKREFEKLKLPRPPQSKLMEVAEILNVALRECELIEKEIVCLEKQKRGIMQTYLWGKI